MSDQRLFSRQKANEIRSELQQIDLKKHKASAIKKKNALKKIIANITMGNYNEMSLLYPEILKFWQVEDDLEVKRICYQFVTAMGPVKPSHAKEALPLILEDLNAGERPLKTMALRTLCSMALPEYTDEALKYTKAIISRNSSSSSLKKTAIQEMIKLDQFAHNEVLGLLDLLYEIIQDAKEPPTVQVSALSALYAIHERNKSMKSLSLTHQICFNMLNLLQNLNEWDKSAVFNSLTTSFVPQTHLDAQHVIDIVLPQLQHVNTSVVLNALKFIMYLINYVDHVDESLIKRFSSSIIALLNKPSELQFLVLRNVILLLLSREHPLLRVEVSYFFVEFNDPIYIKDTKLEILYLLAKDENLQQILNELKEYATDIDIQMSRKAIRAIGNLAVKLEASSSDCVSVLMDLLEFGVGYVVQEIISVFKNILRKYPQQFESCLKTLVKHTDSVQEPESKSSMIWIITQYSSHLPNYLEIFQIFSSNFKDETLDVQFSILNSVVKFFIRSPSKDTEQLCIEVLKSATEDAENPDLRDRAFMYWRLLSSSQQQNGAIIPMDAVREIVDGELPLITLNTRLDPFVLEELELNLGSIASIYLKPVSQVFRLSKTKFLPKSPALNNDREALEIVPDSAGSSSSSQTTESAFNSRSRTNSPTVMKMEDYDKPAEKVNHLKNRRKSGINTSMIVRKPSILARRLSMRKPFA